jgi:hypothetical protein
MNVWFGYHMPNFTFPGVPEDGLFDHVATLADAARPYIDAGFTGFTFNNPVLATPDAIAATGELLGLVA